MVLTIAEDSWLTTAACSHNDISSSSTSSKRTVKAQAKYAQSIGTIFNAKVSPSEHFPMLAAPVEPRRGMNGRKSTTQGHHELRQHKRRPALLPLKAMPE
jgi:hypothetical protein